MKDWPDKSLTKFGDGKRFVDEVLAARSPLDTVRANERFLRQADRRRFCWRLMNVGRQLFSLIVIVWFLGAMAFWAWRAVAGD